MKCTLQNPNTGGDVIIYHTANYYSCFTNKTSSLLFQNSCTRAEKVWGVLEDVAFAAKQKACYCMNI